MRAPVARSLLVREAFTFQPSVSRYLTNLLVTYGLASAGSKVTCSLNTPTHSANAARVHTVTMAKIGESFPPEHFFKYVVGIWILIQLGVLVTLWVRRRQAALEKQD